MSNSETEDPSLRRDQTRSETKIAFVIVGLVILFILGVGGYIVYKLYKRRRRLMNNNEVVQRDHDIKTSMEPLPS